VSNIPIWGADIPLWESRISKSLANGGQPLVRETSSFYITYYIIFPLIPNGNSVFGFSWFPHLWLIQDSQQDHPIYRYYYQGEHFKHGALFGTTNDHHNVILVMVGSTVKTHSIEIDDNIQFWAGDHGITHVTKNNG
jgi:hypothetical protein